MQIRLKHVARFRDRHGTPRPICACCGQAYGQRDVHEHRFTVELGQPVPPYAGNGHLVREDMNPKLPAPGEPEPEPTTWVNMDRGPDGQLRQLGPAQVQRRGRSVTRWTWDGETYLAPYRPFCTLRCALDFAQAAPEADQGAEAAGLAIAGPAITRE